MLKVTLLILLSLTILSASGMPQSNRVPRSPAGITQLVGNRGGRVSCWGVVIQLGNLRFRQTIHPDQIVIHEAKHDHDLRDIMNWHVEQNGKRLVIKFKPGMGDFGSGNRVEVQIDRSAFVGLTESSNDRFDWSMDTDVL
jgi:hypothetical protein